jgi:hypothetical protein
LAEVLDEGGFVLDVDGAWGKAAVEDFACNFAIAAEGGSEAESMGDVESECGNVEFNGFGVGPDACAFFTSDVLDYFVEYFGYDEGVLSGF